MDYSLFEPTPNGNKDKDKDKEVLFNAQYPTVCFATLTPQSPYMLTDDGRMHWLDKSTNTMYSYSYLVGRQGWTNQTMVDSLALPTKRSYHVSSNGMLFLDPLTDDKSSAEHKKRDQFTLSYPSLALSFDELVKQRESVQTDDECTHYVDKDNTMVYSWNYDEYTWSNQPYDEDEHDILFS